MERLYVLMMTSQSIADDVTNALSVVTIVTGAREKRYLTHQILILFMAKFTTGGVRMIDIIKCLKKKSELHGPRKVPIKPLKITQINDASTNHEEFL